MKRLGRVEIRLPIELMIKYEYEASLMGVSLPKYLALKLTNVEDVALSEKINETHKMIKQLHEDYFETED